MPGPSFSPCLRERRSRHTMKARAASNSTPSGTPTPAPTATGLTEEPADPAAAAFVVFAAAAAPVLAVAFPVDDAAELTPAVEAIERGSGGPGRVTTP